MIYNFAWRVAEPAGKWWLRGRPARATVLERLAPAMPRDHAQGRVWVHACSVGEVATVAPLLPALEKATGRSCVLSASTPTGLDRAAKLSPDRCFACPLDHPRAVSRTLDQMQPAALVLMETELWPNLIMRSAACGVPVVIVNGRLSDKHFARYRRYRALLGPMFRALRGVGVQDDFYAARYAELGVDSERIEPTGNLKFDAAPIESDASDRTRLRAEMGIAEHAPVLVFGSTRPGDEALASACWATLRDEQPELRLVIAPRHVDRAEEVLGLFSEPVLRRSAVASGATSRGERVLLVDTVGELNRFYALASLAVIGGSFYVGVEGHNPLEPAGLGVPVVFGPHMANFEQPARALATVDGRARVSTPEDLYRALSDALKDPGELRRRGTLARGVVLEGRGAAERTAAWVAGMMEGQNS